MNNHIRAASCLTYALQSNTICLDVELAEKDFLNATTDNMDEPNCSMLKQLNDFSDYVQALRVETAFNESNLSLCKNEICSCVYGTGNPDISGIGVCDTLSLRSDVH